MAMRTGTGPRKPVSGRTRAGLSRACLGLDIVPVAAPQLPGQTALSYGLDLENMTIPVPMAGTTASGTALALPATTLMAAQTLLEVCPIRSASVTPQLQSYLTASLLRPSLTLPSTRSFTSLTFQTDVRACEGISPPRANDKLSQFR